MTANTRLDSTVDAVVAAVLRDALATARAHGASSVAAEHPAPEQLETLLDATLAHLRNCPGKASPTHHGWSLVTARDAAVLTWWTQAAGFSDGERRRVAPLRRDVYAILIERNRIAAAEGHSTSLHVSPAQPTDIATPGAWVLRLSPYLYDVTRVFGAPDRRVRVWAVENDERSAVMEYGDPVYLWVDEGDPYLPTGIWGVGHVAGPTIPGTADDGWLDHEAATRASVFAVVDITLLEVPVSRHAFLEDPRLADAEVVRDPLAPNPGVLSPTEAAALAEYLPPVGTPAELALA